MQMRISGWLRGLALAIGTAALAAPFAARAEPDRPVVVELYTSQGCSSCPPADALFATLASRDDVIALALHVDYWDYIGWKDVFASPQFTKRQKAYAKAAGRRSIYTPQMVVHGQEDVVGTHPMDVAELVMQHRAKPSPVSLEVSRAAQGEISIRATSEQKLDQDLLVQLVRYRPEARVDVLRGENAGRTLIYTNIVTDWQVLGRWDTATPLNVSAKAPGDEPVVVLIQRAGPGAIEAAARLR